MLPPPPPLDPSATLPSLLACLPTAFASPKPPPALLPLLSPILSQRIQLLSEAPSTTSWLPLLNWDNQEAAQLSKIVESAELEPHPVSGEIEIGSDPEAPKYRRIDEETLQALVNLTDVGIAVVYVWATGESMAWKVSEVKPLHAGWQRNPTPWSDSIQAAQDAFESKTHAPTITRSSADNVGGGEEEEDDSYWDRYDATPGRTPARTPPATAPSHQWYATPSARQPVNGGAEDKYWGQYGSVQPALDANDPDEMDTTDQKPADESTLDGTAFLGSNERLQPIMPENPVPAQRSMFTPNGSKSKTPSNDPDGSRSMYTPNGTSTADSGVAFGLQAFLNSRAANDDESYEHIAHPRPRSRSDQSSSSHKSALVEQLEGQADTGHERRDERRQSRSDTVAEVAVQQHISTSMKSLFRLARGAGVTRADFERIVRNELGVLELLDED